MLTVFSIKGFDEIIAGIIVSEDTKKIYFKNLLAISILYNKEENYLYHHFRPYITDLLYDINSDYVLYKNNIKSRNDNIDLKFETIYTENLAKINFNLNEGIDE